MLQRKGRSELIQIAAALGGKPPSRARKEQIIQLIIDLTTGSTGSMSTSETESATSDCATTTDDEVGQSGLTHAKVANHQTAASAAKATSPDASVTATEWSSSPVQVEQTNSENRTAPKLSRATAVAVAGFATATATATKAGAGTASMSRAGSTCVTKVTGSCAWTVAFPTATTLMCR